MRLGLNGEALLPVPTPQALAYRCLLTVSDFARSCSGCLARQQDAGRVGHGPIGKHGHEH